MITLSHKIQLSPNAAQAAALGWENCGSIKDRDLNASINLKHYGEFVQEKIPEAIGKFKPVEILALAGLKNLVKLGSMKQEFSGEHPCSLER